MILAIIPQESKQKNATLTGMPQSGKNGDILNSPRQGACDSMVEYHLEIMLRTLFKSALIGAFCFCGLTFGQEETAQQPLPVPEVAQPEVAQNRVIPLSLEKIQQDVREKEQIIDSLNLPS